VTSLELKIKDRPLSQSYLLISIPHVEVSQMISKETGRFAKKPDIELKTQIMTIKLEDAMFWYCKSEPTLFNEESVK